MPGISLCRAAAIGALMLGILFCPLNLSAQSGPAATAGDAGKGSAPTGPGVATPRQKTETRPGVKQREKVVLKAPMGGRSPVRRP